VILQSRIVLRRGANSQNIYLSLWSKDVCPLSFCKSSFSFHITFISTRARPKEKKRKTNEKIIIIDNNIGK
jgi:hypothetical protein